MTKAKSAIEAALLGQSTFDRLMGHDALARIQRDLNLGLGQRDIASLIAAGKPAVPDIGALMAAQDAHRNLVEIAKPYGGIAEMMRNYSAQHRQLQDTLDAVGGLAAFERARIEHWAAGLSGPTSAEIAALYPKLSLGLEVNALREQALGILGTQRMTDMVAAGAGLNLSASIREALGTMSVKMSVLAGVGDLSGIGTRVYEDAVRGLMGDWHLRPDLPASFWRDRRVRERHYRRADVDPGLVAAPPPVTVELLVDSGLAAGAGDDQGAVALVTFGGVSLSIRSSDAQADAYRCVVAFERQLRGFIASKLEGLVGSNWFKQRVDGRVFTKAKATRETAIKSGEEAHSLIHYTDLGELKEIILRTDNWDHLFGPVFINRLRFEHDMQTLLAVRRPTAHARIVDSPQMLEALLVMNRLDRQMADDGAWQSKAASDE